ncbi:MAG: hypothetical protein A3H64_01025 [Candidatus Ryanbacteria bacterium RIFCSPLOWO2_02_FULL_45_11c]|uniref:Uncharacterized protein n=1 Tax=Candidatus Ryanbacteria bacterium RIFCSPLOWO2_02_FULL_45_11c TaxID=1802128 RepID=A0A1G2H1Y5_9BACT|nr:MAG: hypothetical protein A3H64_01025 [Candidatus Ryanbacteria bacterium RIFCSPLOWO2_02_FULL_45_11c]
MGRHWQVEEEEFQLDLVGTRFQIHNIVQHALPIALSTSTAMKIVLVLWVLGRVGYMILCGINYISGAVATLLIMAMRYTH